MSAAARGFVSEIFSTLQGEGPRVGERQIFIRLSGCPWRCVYCDTPDSLRAAQPQATTSAEVLGRVETLEKERPHKSVVLTGGEPLTQQTFLSEVLSGLRAAGLSTYLETSGTLPVLLSRVVGLCDMVALDIKLPSAIGRALWTEHENCLRIAAGKSFVKIVLTSASTAEEFARAIRCVAAVEPLPPLILQPVTKTTSLSSRLGASGAQPCAIEPPPAGRVIEWWDWARRQLPDVRLISQMHPVWGLP